jgi:hypothetical protein
MQVYLIFTLHSTNPTYITTHIVQTTPCKKKQVLEETLTLLALIVILVLSSPLEVVPTPADGERYIRQIPDSQVQNLNNAQTLPEIQGQTHQGCLLSDGAWNNYAFGKQKNRC